MFSTKISKDYLMEILKVVSTLDDEAVMNFTPDKLQIKVVDIAHVAMAFIEVKKEAFIEYETYNSKIGVDIESLMPVVKHAEDEVIMTLSDTGEDMIIKFDNFTRRTRLISANSITEPKRPHLKLDHEAELWLSKFKTAADLTKDISETMIFIITPEGMMLHSQSETETMTLDLPADLLAKHKCPNLEKVENAYSFEYIERMIKSITSKKVRIQTAVEQPIRFNFTVADGKADVKYMIAPRLEV